MATQEKPQQNLSAPSDQSPQNISAAPIAGVVADKSPSTEQVSARYAELKELCEHTLELNNRGAYTVPSPLTYPHQWNWDSAFVALGWLEIDPGRAWRELETLMAAQQPNGIVPHLIYATPPAFADLIVRLNKAPLLRRITPLMVGRNYSPSPARWGWQRGGDGRFCSGITQPPFAATAVRLLFEATGDEARARQFLPALTRWHEFLLTERDPLGIGEPVLIHPWESGRDNSPEWDAPLNRLRSEVSSVPRPDHNHVDASERPSNEHYQRYLTLLKIGTRHNWGQRWLAQQGPFRVLDPAFSAILARACLDLSWLACELGESSIAWNEERRAERLISALCSRIGSDCMLRVVDLATDTESDALTCSSALALLIPLLPDTTFYALEEAVVRGPLASRFGVRSLARDDERASPRCYWRGPAWTNITWLCALGLKDRGRQHTAAFLSEQILESALVGGIREYFEPESGEGLGAQDFAWTAALCLRELGPHSMRYSPASY